MQSVTDDMLETATALLRVGQTLSCAAVTLNVNRTELRERMEAAGLDTRVHEPPAGYVERTPHLPRLYDHFFQFPDDAFDWYGLDVPEGVESSYLQLIRIVESTTNSIDIICRKFTSKVMADVFIELHNRPGVEVRVLVNDKELSNRLSQLGYLIASGIPVRYLRSQLSTHCIIDGQFAIIGSMFWTEHGTFRNVESVDAIARCRFIRQLSRRIDELWT